MKWRGWAACWWVSGVSVSVCGWSEYGMDEVIKRDEAFQRWVRCLASEHATTRPLGYLVPKVLTLRTGLAHIVPYTSTHLPAQALDFCSFIQPLVYLYCVLVCSFVHFFLLFQNCLMQMLSTSTSVPPSVWMCLAQWSLDRLCSMQITHSRWIGRTSWILFSRLALPTVLSFKWSKCLSALCLCVTLWFICILHSFSPNGAVSLKRDVTDVNPGRYNLQITVDYTMNFKNGTRMVGSTYENFYFNVLGKSDNANWLGHGKM